MIEDTRYEMHDPDFDDEGDAVFDEILNDVEFPYLQFVRANLDKAAFAESNELFKHTQKKFFEWIGGGAEKHSLYFKALLETFCTRVDTERSETTSWYLTHNEYINKLIQDVLVNFDCKEYEFESDFTPTPFN